MTDIFHNQVLMFAILAAIGAKLYKHADEISRFLSRKVFVMIDVANDDSTYEWVKAWLDKHPYTNQARALAVSTTYDSSEGYHPRLIFTPAAGHHFMRYKGKTIWMTRKIQNPNETTLRRMEEIRLRLFTRDPAYGRQLLEEAYQMSAGFDGKTPIYSVAYGRWQLIAKKQPKPLDSVILPAGLKEDVIETVRGFLDSAEWYRQKGIPYRLGLMFKGVNGTGKGSFIEALAGHFGLKLYMMSIAGDGMNDEKLNDLMLTMHGRCLVVFEDIDAAFDDSRSSKEDKKSRVTFSGLINAIDGVTAPEGRVLIMTTNHRERLNPTLIRKRRIDVEYHFGYATAGQIGQMYQVVFPGERLSPSICRNVAARNVTMAEVQAALLKKRHSAAEAIGELEQIQPESYEAEIETQAVA